MAKQNSQRKLSITRSQVPIFLLQVTVTTMRSRLSPSEKKPALFAERTQVAES